MKSNRTYSAKPADIERKWYVIDASGKTLGRLATRVARLLTGKDKPVFTPHIDCGDYVIVVNASKINLTGNKLRDKIYYRHTGYIGHLKSATAQELLATKPEEVVFKAVYGMIPKNRLGRQIIKKLKIYDNSDHPHKSHKPEILE